MWSLVNCQPPVASISSAIKVCCCVHATSWWRNDESRRGLIVLIAVTKRKTFNLPSLRRLFLDFMACAEGEGVSIPFFQFTFSGQFFALILVPFLSLSPFP